MRHTARTTTQYVSIDKAEQQVTSLRLREEQANYASVCLEDVKLFAQLEELENTDSDELELLNPGGDFDLIELVNGTLPPHHPPKNPFNQLKNSTRSHECHVCGRSFSEAYNLRIHLMTHTNEKPHICDACGKGFRQLNKLRIHYVTHTAERPHKCDICGKGFRYANYLSVHRRLHTGEKPYICSVDNCHLSFHSIHARRVHTKLLHAVTAVESVIDSHSSYTCPICQRVLTDQCYLNTHLKRHYNQRDFVCPQSQCGKRFFSSSELKHHQIAHTQLRPYGCSICSARFLRKSNYQQHLKIHDR